jgi:hypothetical protein
VRRFTILAATLLTLGLIGGCGGGDENASERVRGGDGTGTAEAIPAVSSGVEGVPIPRDTARAPEGKGSYEVLGMSFDEVVDWYDTHLPEGKAFRDWAWCDTGGGAENPSRIYSQGSTRILTVTITDDTPPGVLIGVDKSGPC